MKKAELRERIRELSSAPAASAADPQCALCDEPKDSPRHTVVDVAAFPHVAVRAAGGA